MNSFTRVAPDHTEPTPPPPTDTQRLAECARPAGPAVMYQAWRDLLFLHWQYSAAAIQATLPPGLFVDTHDGAAYLGIVPFVMRNVRPRFLPAVPVVSHFLELNLRTYVVDRAGVPGVWFYSLDANQRLAVTIARRLFHLPYEHAHMTTSVQADGSIAFASRRLAAGGGAAASVFDYRPTGVSTPAAAGSLEFFLAERYRLYAWSPSGLRRGAVHHAPYPLRQAVLTQWDESLLPMNGFAATGRAPDHVCYADGVDVSIFLLTSVAAGS